MIGAVDEALRTNGDPGGLLLPDDAVQKLMNDTLRQFKTVAALNARSEAYQPAEKGMASSKSLMQQLMRQFLTLLHRQAAMVDTLSGLPTEEKKRFLSSTGLGNKLKTLVLLREKSINLTDDQLATLADCEISGHYHASTIANKILRPRPLVEAKGGFFQLLAITDDIPPAIVSTALASRSHQAKKRQGEAMDPQDTGAPAKRSRTETVANTSSGTAQPAQQQSPDGVDKWGMNLYGDLDSYLNPIPAPEASSDNSTASTHLAETVILPTTYCPMADLPGDSNQAIETTTPSFSFADDWLNTEVEDWDLLASGNPFGDQRS